MSFLTVQRTRRALLLLACAVAAWAQDTRATLLGTVLDQSGAAVENATVTATAQATGLSRTAITDRQGQYRIPLLQVGAYTLRVEARQFAVADVRDLSLRVAEERRADVDLSLASIGSSVTVSAPITDSVTATLSTVIPQERVANLPLNGRQLQELALTAPGVSAGGGFRSDAFNQFGLATPTDGNAGAFSVNGAPSRSNGFFLDGVDINVPEQGVISFPPLVESIREFQIQTSLFAAEYGRFSGSIVQFVTKSGSNEFHGNVYHFLRNDKLDAANFFNNANGLPRTILKLNQFGATLGGPLQRNRHFFFGNYEGNRVRQGTGPFGNNVPTAAQRTGRLAYTAFTDANGNGRFDANEPTSPATLDLAARLSPISSTILRDFIPLPNATTAGANYIAEGINRMDEDAITVRTDSQLTAKDLFTARYSLDDQRQFYPFDIFFVAASLPAFPFPNPERRQSLALSHTRTITPSLLNEFRFGLNRQRNPIPNGTEIDPASIGLPNGVPQNEFGRGLPVFRVTGFGGTGGQPLVDNLGASTTNRTLFQTIDNVSFVRGAHSLKLGGELRRVQVNQSQYRPLRGALTFNGARNGLIDPTVPGNAAVAALADFLLGQPAQATISSANPTRGFRTLAFSGFVQDEWRASRRLTLSLGLRYEIDTPLTEVNGLLSNLIPGVGNFVVGSPELPRLHRLDKNNFAPRFGFAYRLTEDGRMTVRGGAGVFYDNGVLQDRFGTARTNAPFAVTAIDNNPAAFPTSGPATTLTRLLGTGQATSAASVDLDFRTPYALQHNLSLQRELAPSLLAEVAYVGRRGLNMSRQVNINQSVAVNSPAAALLPVGSRPYSSSSVPLAARFANDIIQQQFNGQSTYHSLQVRVERRFTGGSSFLGSYTWSKSIDDVSGIGTGADDRPQDSYNLRAQRAVSNFDIPHRFVLGSVYSLPFGRGRRFLADAPAVVQALISGWQTSSVTTYQSGQPFTATVGVFDGTLGISNKRPNLVGEPDQNVPAGFSFNPAAFAAPATGQLGNVGRNSLRGGAFINSDFSVLRQFAVPVLGDTGSLQFRAEFFNLYNHPNFTLPVSSLASSAAGRFVSNATSPRVIQFALKLGF